MLINEKKKIDVRLLNGFFLCFIDLRIHYLFFLFFSFDLDKRQVITLENLRAVIGDTYNGSRVEEIMELCDANGDGVIDFDEVSYKIIINNF